MTRRVAAILAGLALTVTSCTSGSRAAHAEAPRPSVSSSTGTESSPTSVPSSSTAKVGYDVSYPQCGRQLPKNAAFGIVGLNGQNGATFNPCFKDQLAWAKRLGGTKTIPADSVYAHTQNAGAKLAEHWPSSGDSPYGTCDGSTSPSCSLIYGEQRASTDSAHLKAAGFIKGVVNLDVEYDDYTWQDSRNNIAAIEGMVSTFEHDGYTVGIYSDRSNWNKVTGGMHSDILSHLSGWVLGADSVAQARANCTYQFVGPNAISQVPGINGTLDTDVPCAA